MNNNPSNWFHEVEEIPSSDFNEWDGYIPEDLECIAMFSHNNKVLATYVNSYTK